MRVFKKCLFPMTLGLTIMLSVLFGVVLNFSNVEQKCLNNISITSENSVYGMYEDLSSMYVASADLDGDESEVYNVFFDGQDSFDVGLNYVSSSDGFEVVGRVEDKLAWYTIEGCSTSVGFEENYTYGVVINVTGLNSGDTITTNFGTTTFSGTSATIMRITGLLEATESSQNLNISISSTSTSFELSVYGMTTSKMDSLGIDESKLIAPFTVRGNSEIPASLPYIPTKDNYMFGGYWTGEDGDGDKWYDENGNSTGLTSETNADVSLYSYWVRHEIYVVANGGIFAADSELEDYDSVSKIYSYIDDEGDTIGGLPTPTTTAPRTSFKGWYSSSSSATVGAVVNVASSDKLTPGNYYIAVWEQIVNIEITINNGSISTLGSCSAEGEYTVGQTLTLNYSTITNYSATSWLKWVKNDDGDQVSIGSGVAYQKYSVTGGVLSYTITEDDLEYNTITFEAYASYTLNIHAVTAFEISSVGGSISGSIGDTTAISWIGTSDIAADEDQNVTLYAKSVTGDREFNFIGWYLRSIPTEENYSLTKLVATSDCTYVSDGNGDYYKYEYNPGTHSGGGAIYALFLEDEKQVYLLGNDTTFESDDRLSNYGSYKMLTYTKGDRDTVGDLPVPINSNANAVFAGWRVQDSSVIDSLVDNTNDSDELIEGKYYVSIWTITLTYGIEIFIMDNTGAYSATANYNYSSTATAGTEVLFTTLVDLFAIDISGAIEYSYATFSPDGTTFASATSGVIVAGEDEYSSNSVVRLYYNRVQHLVTLNSDGGTISSTTGWTISGSSSTKSVYYEAQIGTLPTATKEGYIFNGWVLSNGSKLTNVTQVLVDDIVATADFSVDYKEIIFDDMDSFDVEVNYINNLITGGIYATMTEGADCWYQLKNKEISLGFVNSGTYGLIVHIIGLNDGDSVTSTLGNKTFSSTNSAILRLDGLVSTTSSSETAIKISLTTTASEIEVGVYGITQANMVAQGIDLAHIIPPVKVAQNVSILSQLPIVPNRDHYTFTGYYTEANGAGTMWYNESATSTGITYSSTSNTVLYSNWNKVVYTLTLTPSSDTSSTNIEALSMTGSDCTVSNSSGVFTIQHEYSSETIEITIGSSLTTPVYMSIGGDEYQLLSRTYGWIPDQNITVEYSMPDMYNIIVQNLSGVSSAVIYINENAQSETSCWVKKGETVKVEAQITAGYGFNGWYSNSNVTSTSLMSTNNPYTFDPSLMGSSTITLFAYSNANTYTIKYNANAEDAEGTMSDSVHTYDVARALNSNMYTRPNYKFAGWAVSATGTAEYVDGATVKNLTEINNDVINLYVVWAELEYVDYIIYSYVMNTNGAFGTPISNTLTEKEFTEIKIVNLVSTLNIAESGKLSASKYYIGKGSSTMEGSDITSTEIFTIPAKEVADEATPEITIYFIREKYLATLNADGGTCIEDNGWNVNGEIITKEIYYQAQVGFLPVVAKDKYIFTGWVLDNNSILTAEHEMGTGAINATAHYERDLNHYLIFDNQESYDVGLAYTNSESGFNLTISNNNHLKWYSCNNSIIALTIPSGMYGVVIYVKDLNSGDLINVTINENATSLNFGTNPILRFVEEVDSDEDTTISVSITTEDSDYSINVFAMSWDSMESMGLTSFELMPPINVVEGNLIPELPGIPERDNYVFKGYYTAENGTGDMWYDELGNRANLHTYSSQEDTKLYAYWELEKHTIYAYREGCDESGKSVTTARFTDWPNWDSEAADYSTAEYLTKTLTIWSDFGELPTLQAEGYKFVGWYDALADGDMVDSSSVLGAEDINIYPCWEKEKTLLADANGGIVLETEGWTLAEDHLTASKKLYKGDVYGALPDAERAGYTFVGWFTDTTSGVQVNSSDEMEDEDVVIYAVWETNNYTINFNASNGSEITSVQAEFGSTITLPDAPSRDGYTFKGWADSVINDSLPSEYNANYANSTISVTSDIFSKYISNLNDTKYNFSYELNVFGQYSSNYPTIMSEDNSTVGYMVIGYHPDSNQNVWNNIDSLYDSYYVNNMGVQTLTPSEWLTSAHSIYMYGQSITFDEGFDFSTLGIWVQGLEFVNEEGNVNKGNTSSIQYWVMYSDGDLYQASTSYSINKSDNTTLYAIWEPINYTVTFHANGGVFEEFPDDDSVENSDYIYESYLGDMSSLERLGFNFEGWFTEQNGGTEVTSTTQIKGDMDIYAHWTSKLVEVEVTTRTSYAEILSEGYDTSGSYSVEGDLRISYSVADNFNPNGWILYYLDDKDNVVKQENIAETTLDRIITPEDSLYKLKFEAVATYNTNLHAVTDFEIDSSIGGEVSLDASSWSASELASHDSNITTTIYAKPAEGYTFIAWYLRIEPQEDSFQGGSVFVAASSCTLTSGYYSHDFHPNTFAAGGEIGGGEFYALFLPENVIRFDNELLPKWDIISSVNEATEYVYSSTNGLRGISAQRTNYSAGELKITIEGIDVPQGAAKVGVLFESYNTSNASSQELIDVTISSGTCSQIAQVSENGQTWIELEFGEGMLNSTLTFSVQVTQIHTIGIIGLSVQDLSSNSNVAPQGALRVAYGDTIPDLTKLPTLEGYVFDGYYTGANGTGTQWYNASGEALIDTYTDVDDVRLYSKWITDTRTLTIDPNGGQWNETTSTTSMTKPYGTSEQILNPIRDGYDFIGWSITTNKGTDGLKLFTVGMDFEPTNMMDSIDFGYGYHDFSSTNTFIKGLTLSMWVYSNDWQTSTGGIFNNGNGSGSVAHLNKVTLQSSALNIVWNYSADLTNVNVVEINVQHGLTGSGWHLISIVGDGETLACYIDGKLKSSAEASGHLLINRSLYLGANYYDGIDCIDGKVRNVILSNAAYSAEQVSSLYNGILTYMYEHDNVTLTAQWAPKIYDVSMDRQEGTGGADAVYYKYNTYITIEEENYYYYSSPACYYDEYINSIQIPTRVGYEFGGYYTAINGEGTQVVDSQGNLLSSIYNTIGGATVYANWIAKEVEVEVTTATSYAEIISNDSSTSGMYRFGDALTLKYETVDNFGLYTWIVFRYDEKDAVLNGEAGEMISTTNGVASYQITADDVGVARLEFRAIAQYNVNVNSCVDFELSSDEQVSTIVGGAVSNDYNAGTIVWYGRQDGVQLSTQSATLYAKPADGYVFEGWYLRVQPTLANFQQSDVLLAKGELITDNNGTYYQYSYSPNITSLCDGQIGGGEFYALFLKKSSISIIGDNGIRSSSIDEEEGTKFEAIYGYDYNLKVEVNDGYSFNGWYLTADGAGDALSKAETFIYSMIKTDVDIYAITTSNNYQITLNYNGGTDNKLKHNLSAVDGTFESGIGDFIVEYSKGINELSTIAFNGNYSLHIVASEAAETNGKLTYNNHELIPGYKYVLRFKVLADVNSEISYSAVGSSELALENTALSNNTWTYITLEFTADSSEVISTNFVLDLGVNYYFDDIEIICLEASYTPSTTINYDVTTPLTKLPHAIKDGYAFKGWYAESDGRGNPITTYEGSLLDNVTYYAIYELSNPTNTITADNEVIKYGEQESTLTSVVNSYGLDTQITYQWHLSTDANFIPSESTIIQGATESSYVHTDKFKSVGNYYYRCVVTIKVGDVISKGIASNAQLIQVVQGETSITIEMTDYQYGGDLASPTVTSNISGGNATFYYNETNSSVDGLLWSEVTSSTYLDVGTYYMYAIVDANGNYTSAISNIVEFRITEGEMKIEVTTNNNNLFTKVYDGLALEVFIKPSVDATINIGVEENTYITHVSGGANTNVSIGNITNVGDKTIYYQATSPNYASIAGSVTISVTAKEVEVKWITAEPYTYNGTDQSSSVKAYYEVGEDQIDCLVEFDKEFKNADTYLTTATTNDINYSLIEPTKTIKISKAVVTILAEDKTIAYGDGSVEYSYATQGDVYDAISVTYTLKSGDVEVELTTETNAGKYTIIPRCNLSTANYDITYANATLTIEKYNLSNAIVEPMDDVDYTGLAYELKPTVSALGKNLVEGVDFEYSYQNNVNVGTATIIVTAKEDGNYTGSNQTSFNIISAEIAIPELTGTLVYDGTLKTAGIEDSEWYAISNNTAIDAGDYSATVTLIDTLNYVWSDGTTEVKIIPWNIEKADTSIEIEKSSVEVRMGDIITNIATVNYVGELESSAIITTSGGEEYVQIQISDILNYQSCLTISANQSIINSQTIIVEFSGDKNHNPSSTTFTVTVPVILVQLTTNGSGSVEVKDYLKQWSDTQYEVSLDSEIYFIATPDSGYALLSYSLNGEFIYNTDKAALIGEYKSSTIKITEDVLNDDVLSIVVEFAELSEVVFEIVGDEGSIGELQFTVKLKDEEQQLAYIYENNMLTTFKGHSLTYVATANKVDQQYYIINTITTTISGQSTGTTKVVNVVQKTETLGVQNVTICINVLKVYDATDRDVYDDTNSVAIIKVQPTNQNDLAIIDNKNYIIENSEVDCYISKVDSNYDFLGIKIGEELKLYNQSNANEWEYDGTNTTYIWKNQVYTSAIATAKAVVLERWYTPNVTTNREISVVVDSGITAELINAEVGYKYTLSSGIFTTGESSLYTGTWTAKLVSGQATVGISVTTNGVTKTYQVGDEFEINSDTTKVVITITK